MSSVRILDAITAGLSVALVSLPAAAQSISQPAGCIAGVDCSAKSLSTSGNVTAGSTISTTGGDFWFNLNGGRVIWGTLGDVVLNRDGAGALGLRNGVNAQTFNLYGTYTDSSNFERLTLAYDSGGGRFRVFGQRAGTGSGRSLDLGGEGPSVFFTTNSVQRWQIDSSGNLLASTDNGWNIGAVGATRPANVYIGTNLVLPAGSLLNDTADGTIRFSNHAATNLFTMTAAGSGGIIFGGSIASTGDISAGSFNFSAGTNSKFQWNGGAGYFTANSSGVIQINGNSGNPILQFGGATSSFPAIKRTSASLQIRLADDSGDADLVAGNITTSTDTFIFSGRGQLVAPADGNQLMRNAAGTSFGLLQFGGTTSSFPAWKRNGAAMEARLADDSADANVVVGGVTLLGSGATPVSFSAGATYDIGTPATPARGVYASFASSAISSQSGTSYTVGQADGSLIFTSASTITVTLPTASSFTGRQLRVKGTGGGALNSASSNVVPLAGGSAAAAILSASAGKWALLQSDGTNWIIMAAN